jgi:protein-tyrosine phosphatase
VLMVCTANMYRSPLAAALLRAAVDGGPRIEVTSAGTYALVGARMAPEAASLAARLGAPDQPEHRARALEPSMIHEADLVLAMARDHREWILREAPSAMKRVFTLREFAHLVAAVPDVSPSRSRPSRVGSLEVDGESLRARVAQLAANRGVVHALNDSADADVIDPFGMPAAAHDRCAAQLVPALDEVGRFLVPAEVAA